VDGEWDKVRMCVVMGGGVGGGGNEVEGREGGIGWWVLPPCRHKSCLPRSLGSFLVQGTTNLVPYMGSASVLQG
jgi:hypothetical protein